MTTDIGLRERKKQRTRRALTQAALRLFSEQGFEATTVAQIAAEAEVSTKTFFSYFPSKPDVVFADPAERLDAGVEAISTLAKDEPPLAAIEQAVNILLAPTTDTDPHTGLLRQRLIATEPTVQARAMFHTLDAESRLVDALHRAYPDSVDRSVAVAAIGALVGSLVASLYESVRQGHSVEDMRQAARRATQIAIDGLASAMP